jgi:hypothetical protein
LFDNRWGGNVVEALTAQHHLRTIALRQLETTYFNLWGASQHERRDSKMIALESAILSQQSTLAKCHLDEARGIRAEFFNNPEPHPRIEDRKPVAKSLPMQSNFQNILLSCSRRITGYDSQSPVFSRCRHPSTS